ncbi:aldo/keto reductase [Halococcus salifodinae]|uniref:Aldo/keto reductase n=1 Tax=Halococcus salifodinae DSM 8989 TaxID=1227456 RepID=M0NCN6_9EURY|nr:aldo/keto reductase [Halococcus salifodinae]EMA54435.1 aldo/keto reductase [Halococcus salifodinae DSM 8989]
MPVSIPGIGLGTYSNTDKDQWKENVCTALEAGYRHVDTAEAYDNEQYVGAGIEAASVDRDDVFLATKVAHPDSPVPEREDVLSMVDSCLDRLRTDHVNLLYVHWPADPYDPETTLGAFQELYDDGKIEHVGISNFEPETLDTAHEVLDAPIVANQIECHPLLQQEDLREYARRHDHWIVAFCPLAQGEVFDHPEIQAVAEKHNASPAQVSLAWLLSKDNVAVIPKASSEAHMWDNLAAQDLDLDDEDIAKIDGIEREHRIIDREYARWRN